MKKTFLAMLLVGGSMSMFAQTTGSGSTTSGTGSTTTPTTNSSTNPTMGSTTNSSTTNGSMNSTTNNGAWNGVSTPSTSWAPETAPTWGWNSYGIWNNYGMNNGSANNTTTYGSGTNAGTVDNSASMNSSNNGNMSSTGAYNAYGTAVANLPANVQYRFNQDFPAGVNNQYSWNQYGDWFHTYYMNNGRLTQYFYDQRGNGYALALPVLQTYVPENIITSALQKYGSNLYSIAMVKTNNGSNAYQIGLLQHGQINTQYLDDNGATVADVWRTEDMNNGNMNATQSNAAMGTDGSMSNSNSSSNWNNSSNSNTDMSNSSSTSGSDMSNQSTDSGKTKLKIKHADGSIDKIKTKNGQTKIKSKPAPDNMNNNQQ